MNVTGTIESSVRRLFPNMSLEQALTTMLLERAQRNLIKYQTMARQFQAKYGQDFETFRQSVLDTHPSQDVEQDYFEWELAITGILDMEEEIQRLRDSG